MGSIHQIPADCLPLMALVSPGYHKSLITKVFVIVTLSQKIKVDKMIIFPLLVLLTLSNYDT